MKGLKKAIIRLYYPAVVHDLEGVHGPVHCPDTDRPPPHMQQKIQTSTKSMQAPPHPWSLPR